MVHKTVIYPIQFEIPLLTNHYLEEDEKEEKTIN